MSRWQNQSLWVQSVAIQSSIPIELGAASASLASTNLFGDIDAMFASAAVLLADPSLAENRSP